MDALPNQSDAQFQAFLNRLLEQPKSAWTEKQWMELDMALALSTQMLQIAERMRDGQANLENSLVLLRYAKVLDFILSSLAARRDIHPQTLRTIFRLANIKIVDEYPE
ncbi:DNA-binding protein [Burkholderia ubonensis]|uniref:DNA-binding protein n=1 Tax=Burkholderia ubonensis TaxID=101571 RepID=UPI0008FDBE13|nr:DNA-binding protein [Burkholderia ubonensis]OJA31599.1 DNA-binding protein [Burkholderia ubonensis]OJB30901.1 DNA-binding protein [Burkholderia ubonensis]